MAKGNLFLGTAARSVGDVVMYRREGSQVSRVRVRKIANPKTDAQCKQRAIMSAIVKFYQPLARVLERSWQGLSTPKSYAKFLAINAKLAKKNSWYVAKGTGFFPLELQLSSGTLGEVNARCSAARFTVELAAFDDATASLTTVGQLSTMFVNAGYKIGDVVTMILCIQDSMGKYSPYTIQFAVDTESTDLVTTLSGMFTFAISGAGSGTLIITTALGSTKGFGVIVSREKDGSWLRTKCVFDTYFDDEAEDYPWTDEKIAAAIASYGNNPGGDNPLVYLDGDELENA